MARAIWTVLFMLAACKSGSQSSKVLDDGQSQDGQAQPAQGSDGQAPTAGVTIDSVDPAILTTVGAFRPLLSGALVAAASGFSNCNFHDFPTSRESINVKPDCQFDTLYVWGPSRKIAHYRDAFTRGDRAVQPPLWTNPSPLAGYMLGDSPLRLKLKPNLSHVVSPDYVYSPDCGQHPDNTVYYRMKLMPKFELFEIYICSMETVESISTVSREFLMESLRDLALKLDRQGPAFFSYKLSGSFELFGDGLAVDGSPMTEPILATRLRTLVSNVKANGDQPVLFRKGAGDPASHFATGNPTGFNPN